MRTHAIMGPCAGVSGSSSVTADPLQGRVHHVPQKQKKKLFAAGVDRESTGVVRGCSEPSEEQEEMQMKPVADQTNILTCTIACDVKYPDEEVCR